MARRTTFSRLFAAWRYETELTQQQISEILTQGGFPYDRTTISKLETGDRQPNGEILAALSICFKISEEETALWIRAITQDFQIGIISKNRELRRKFGG